MLALVRPTRRLLRLHQGELVVRAHGGHGVTHLIGILRGGLPMAIHLLLPLAFLGGQRVLRVQVTARCPMPALRLLINIFLGGENHAQIATIGVVADRVRDATMLFSIDQGVAIAGAPLHQLVHFEVRHLRRV